MTSQKGKLKNEWAKKFIKRIEYSKEEIEIVLYYHPEGEPILDSNTPKLASGWVGAASGPNPNSFHSYNSFCQTKSGQSAHKKTRSIQKDTSGRSKWLPNPKFQQTISIILPNTIHKSKKKNL